MENIVISSELEFEHKKAILKNGGAQNLYVVADCDRTLTRQFLNGEKRHSLVELIRKHKYLPDAYVKEAYELFEKYHPIEIDPTISIDTKRAKMNEWWSTHVKRMAHYGMSRDVIKKMLREQEFGAREGLRTFLDRLSQKQIPLLVFSASVTDFIEGFLKKEKMGHANIHIVSNKYAFDAEGKVMGYEGPIVHSLNKNQIVIKGTPYFEQIRNRKNVILLGDTLDDVGMVEGMKHDCVLKIGFLNDHVERDLDAFKKAFDVVILNDGPMDFANDLLKEIFT